MNPTTQTLQRLQGVRTLIDLALTEDIGRGDRTTEATVLQDTRVQAEILQKQPGVLCGLPIAELVFATLDTRLRMVSLVDEGSWSSEQRVVATLEGSAHTILSGERTALNFIQRLSGVATISRHAVELVRNTQVTVLDTRKTTPGHRILEKYAVRIGGCHNHRAGLDDGILIKDNHIRAAGSITTAVKRAQQSLPPMGQIEVEVTTIDELYEAIQAGAQVLLVDNASPELLRTAVSIAKGRVKLEASGGVTLENLYNVAQTGVDYISLGALTHSAPSIDFSLEIR